MGTIVIKDLPENTELDRKAMEAISGGSRLRSGTTLRGPARPAKRLFDFAASATGKAAPAPKTPSR